MQTTNSKTKLQQMQEVYERLGWYVHDHYPGHRAIMVFPGSGSYVTIYKNGKVRVGKYELK